MISILVAVLVAFVATAGSVPLVRALALRAGAVDSPTARRVHTRRVPRLGGIAIVVGFFLPLAVLFLFRTSLAAQLFVHRRLVAGFCVGALLVAALGVADDLKGVSAGKKFAVQVLAAAIAYWAGFRIGGLELPVVGTIALGWFAPIFTGLWIVGIINALNLIDGLDGLAGGVAFFVCVTNFVIARLGGDLLVCLVTAALAGALIGFLFHNFEPATIFMGDSGSMFLGFALATMSVFSTTTKGTTAVAILVPIVALGLPIVDTLFAMVRRVLEGRSIFSADRRHIHHQLLALGLTQRRVVLILYGTCVLLAVGSVAIYISRSWQSGLTLLGLTLGIVATFRVVGALNATVNAHLQRIGGREPLVERLRRKLPALLAQLDAEGRGKQVPVVLSSFAAEAGLLAVELRPEGAGSLVPAWRWEVPETTNRAIHDAVSATFLLVDDEDKRFTLKFHWDSEKGTVHPQAEILLQVAADAVEGALWARSRSSSSKRNAERVSTG